MIKNISMISTHGSLVMIQHYRFARVMSLGLGPWSSSVALPGKRLHSRLARGASSFWLMALRLPSLLSARCTPRELKSVVPLFASDLLLAPISMHGFMRPGGTATEVDQRGSVQSSAGEKNIPGE